MKSKIAAIIVTLAMACAMVPALAFAAVTDIDSDDIIRTTTTKYFTTLTVNVYERSAEGVRLTTATSEEIEGDINDEVVVTKKNAMVAEARALVTSQNRAELSLSEGVTDAYYKAYDEIINNKTDGDDEPKPMAGGKVTINTVLERHQTYTVNIIVTELVMPSFVAAQDSPVGSGELQGASYIAMSGENLIAVDGTASYTVDGKTYTEDALRGYVATLPVGTTKTVAFTFAATGDFAGYKDSGSFTITVVAAAQTYKIIEGAQGSYTIGGSKGLTFRSDADFSLFNRVVVDGVVLPSSSFTATAGSTVVELSAAFLSTLAPGTHSISIVSGMGASASAATTEFTVVQQQAAAQTTTTTTSATPKTGDALPLVPVAAVCLGSLLVLMAVRKRLV